MTSSQYDGRLVAIGETLDTPVEASIVVLAMDAREGRLAICAGAGLSVPVGLPSGSQLAGDLHARFERIAGFECATTDDLLAVADAAAQLPEGLAAVQRVVLELAPFSEATPALGHELLALLVAEDAVRLLLTNWDNCVERSWRRVEEIPVARNAVEAENLSGHPILKIHGCCTQGNTLLITSEQLRDAPLWTRTHFGGELARSTMVFVGIGDVADYARKRIVELAEHVEHARIRVVSRTIISGWEGSEWQGILPDLPEERRIQGTADDFVDQLAREWVMGLVAEVKKPPGDEAAPWLDAVATAFSRFTALQALTWLRKAGNGWKVGQSLVWAPASASALEALGLLAREPGTATIREIRFSSSGGAGIGDEMLDVIICPERRTPPEIERAAEDRVRSVSRLRGPAENLHLLVAASSIRGQKPRILEAADIVDPEAPADELIGGERRVSVRLTYADDVLEAA